jgi:hypothetical protein
MNLDVPRELRTDLRDPCRVAEALGLEPSREERNKWRCPAHGGRSLSLRVGQDGTLQAKCFGCGLSGDVLTLIAAADGYRLPADFRPVLRRAAELAGRRDLLDTLERSDMLLPPPPPRPERPASPPTASTYPPGDELGAVLDALRPVADDDEARAMLEGRSLDVARIDDLRLAGVLPLDAQLPTWARTKDGPWTKTGHRLIVPVVDASGDIRSVRAWRLTNEAPKRVAPTKCKLGGLVLACPNARAMLAGQTDGLPSPLRVIVVEGEPDFLTWATRFSDADGDAPVVLGIVAGAWTDTLAARIPDGAHVYIRTDHDAAGDKYAAEIASRVRNRCAVYRSLPRTKEIT